MEKEGPPLELLTHRLAETPQDFLGVPRFGDQGAVHVAAVVNDFFRLQGGGTARPQELQKIADSSRESLAVTLVLCWLLADQWFLQQHPTAERLLNLLSAESTELAQHTAASKFVSDPERREELARLALARLGWRPSGETVAQAQDRLTSLSAAERDRLLRASRAAEERAREIRLALARKAAEESADKWTRE